LIQPQTSKIPCRCHIQEINSSEYLIQYIPTEPGRYQLRVLFNNQLVQGKPLDTDVYPSLPQISKANTPSPIVRIQQILPNNSPEIGDDICLQSKQYFLVKINSINSLLLFLCSQYRKSFSIINSRSNIM
jgi:hypothetical protein